MPSRDQESHENLAALSARPAASIIGREASSSVQFIFRDMRKQIRRAALHLLRNTGIFRLLRESEWRRQRLLILCYHGISLEDEHQWRPGLYMEPRTLEQRLRILRTGDYNVLPLGEALQRLYAKELPRRSVSITFDDGAYDFYKQAYPIVKRYG